MTDFEKKYLSGIPDYTGEKINLWKNEVNKELEHDLKNDVDYNPYKIDYKGIIFEAFGFTLVSDKNNNELFLYKFKHNEKLVMYYIIQDSKEVAKAIEILKLTSELAGYQCNNFEVYLDDCVEQMRLEIAEQKFGI